MKSTNKITLLLILVVTAALMGGCSSSAKIGIVDMNKISTDSPKIKQLQDQLNVKGKEMSDQLVKDKATLSPDDYKKREETVYGEFVKIKQDMETQFETSIKDAVGQVSTDKKLGVVLYKSGVAQGGTDITDEVITKLQ